MNNQKLLTAILKVKGQCELTISGVSMLPILRNGQIVQVVRVDSYQPGDILVYEYKNEGLLAHRLLRIDLGRYFCKGDNSFRLEDITLDQIVGKIVLEHDPGNTPVFLQASYEIERLFRRCGYDREKTMAHPLYQEYRQTYLETHHDEI